MRIRRPPESGWYSQIASGDARNLLRHDHAVFRRNPAHWNVKQLREYRRNLHKRKHNADDQGIPSHGGGSATVIAAAVTQSEAAVVESDDRRQNDIGINGLVFARDRNIPNAPI